MRSYVGIIRETSKALGIPEKIVSRAYRAYWRAVREHVASLPLKEDLSDEDFSKLRTNVNIPSIGKLHVTPERYRSIKDSFSRMASGKQEQQASSIKHQTLGDRVCYTSRK